MSDFLGIGDDWLGGPEPGSLDAAAVQRAIEELRARSQVIETRLAGLEALDELYAKTAAADTRTNTAFGDLAGGAGPSVTIPSSGTWLVTVGAYVRTNTLGTSGLIAVQVGASVPADTDAAQKDVTTANNGASITATVEKALTAGDVVKAVYRATGAATVLARDRWIRARRIA